MEKAKVYLDLTAEELEQHVINMAERKKEQMRVNQAKYNSGLRETDPEGYKARSRAHGKKQREKNPAPTKAANLKHRKKNIALKKYYCSLCGTACETSTALKTHNATKKHQRALAALELEVDS